MPRELPGPRRPRVHLGAVALPSTGSGTWIATRSPAPPRPPRSSRGVPVPRAPRPRCGSGRAGASAERLRRSGGRDRNPAGRFRPLPRRAVARRSGRPRRVCGEWAGPWDNTTHSRPAAPQREIESGGTVQLLQKTRDSSFPEHAPAYHCRSVQGISVPQMRDIAPANQSFPDCWG